MQGTASGGGSEFGSSLVGAEVVARHYAVSPSTVSRWAASGAVPCIRIGRTIRFDLEQVRETLEASK